MSAAGGRGLARIEQSLLVNRMRAIAEEMGATLRRAAFSPNIKDRLDYSCAVFNASGELCAQAAHIPVHLGSMAYAMRSIVRDIPWAPGDMVMVNDPYLGGTHLPDVTVVAPLFCARQRLVAFVANRAHHADIGCARPGSMPLSHSLDEEGLVISPTKLLSAGQPNVELHARLRTALRNPAATLADISAQLSANRIGLARLSALADSLAVPLSRAFDHANDYAERMARSTLSALPPGTYSAVDCMDQRTADGTPVEIAARLAIAPGGLTVDFEGTSAQIADANINCPLSVTAAAVYYVFHCLMPRETPACAGSLRPVRIVAPAGSLVNARRPAAVAAGNVETSQRIVDVLLRALAAALPGRIPAASCGSMNNVAFGGHSWAYYETIGGGGGAHAQGPGLDAAHTHMTNTLNTPIEVLELVHPVRVRCYAIRRSSGGGGLFRGGDGIEREFEFLAPASVTVLSERRRSVPWGLDGGEAGAAGRNLLNGRELPPSVEFEANPGDRLRICTPGGGGWGAPPPD